MEFTGTGHGIWRTGSTTEGRNAGSSLASREKQFMKTVACKAQILSELLLAGKNNVIMWSR
jgi:hypothetical protein